MDYVNIEIKNIDVQRLINLSKLDFRCQISKSTGYVDENVFIANYIFCYIEIKTIKPDNEHPNRPVKQYVDFRGSIHKMWNGLNGVLAPNYQENKPYNGFNGNQFNINNIFEVREHLTELFDCNSSQMIFHGLEFGVNTILKFYPKLFVKGLLYHRNTEFEFSHQRNTAEAEHQLWKFKIYNKSIQYGMDSHVLRIESKTKKMEDINCRYNKNGIENKYYIGIKTFEDVNEDTLKKLSKLLLKRFDEVVYYDFTIKKKNLSKTNLKNIQNYSSQNYWINDLESNRRDRPKTILKSIIVNHSDNLHEQIRKDIIEKCVINNRLLESSKCVIINPLYRLLNTTQKQDVNNTLCKVTGLDISMQKKDSIFLSHTGLKHFYKTDRKVFDKIKLIYLSYRWYNSDLDKQILEIAHDIRNTNSNQGIKQDRLYPTQQTNLLRVLGM